MHVTTALPPAPLKDNLCNLPGSAPWLTLLHPPSKQHAPETREDAETDKPAKPTQARADSTSVRPRQAAAEEKSTSDSKETASGASSSGASRRTVFSRHQLSELEARFREQTFLSKEERAQMAEDLGLTERQIMIWFQNRRGRLKRRGPSDNAYSAEKLKELNTRRPYPFLYGLLSSMQYRYPDTHHHPYQHLIEGNSTTRSSHVSDINVSSRDSTVRYPHATYVNASHHVTHQPASHPVTHVTANVTLANNAAPTPPSGMTSNPTTTGIPSHDVMPPNVTVHQMTSSSHRGPLSWGDQRSIGTMNGYPQMSRSGPIRHQHTQSYYHQHHHPYHSGRNAWPAMPQQTFHHPTPHSFHSSPPQAPTSCTTSGHYGHGLNSPDSGRGETTPPPVNHTSPVSSAGSSSPVNEPGASHVAMVQTSGACLGRDSSITSAMGILTGVSSAAHGYDFNPQIDFNYVPDFPDITSTLYPFTSQTC